MNTIPKSTGKNSHIALYIFAILFVLLLDWAALHDIIKGEASILAEYSMLVFSLITIPYLLFRIYKK